MAEDPPVPALLLPHNGLTETHGVASRPIRQSPLGSRRSFRHRLGCWIDRVPRRQTMRNLRLSLQQPDRFPRDLVYACFAESRAAALDWALASPYTYILSAVGQSSALAMFLPLFFPQIRTELCRGLRSRVQWKRPQYTRRPPNGNRDLRWLECRGSSRFLSLGSPRPYKTRTLPPQLPPWRTLSGGWAPPSCPCPCVDCVPWRRFCLW